MQECKALKAKCSNCSKIGHFTKVCQQKNVNRVDNTEEQEDSIEETTEMDTCQLNIWNIQLSNNLPKFTAVKNDFKKNLLVNNRLVKILIDTGAKVSVCGEQQAKLWGIYDKMKPSFAKIHPYNSTLIKVTGTALCSASFKNRAVPGEFYILPRSRDPILDGNKAEQLKIISLDKDDNHVFNPVLMISSQEKDGEFINNICSILQHYPQNFKGLGKLRNYQVKLYTDNSIKSVAVPPRSVPYHLKGRVFDAIDNMLKEGVIEQRPTNDPSMGFLRSYCPKN